MKRTILVEGWRFVPHSYSCVNMWQCLELLRRDVTLYHRDRPYYDSDWKPSIHLFEPSRAKALRSLPPPDSSCTPDVVLRIAAPFDFAVTSPGRHFIFATTEYGVVIPSMLAGGKPLSTALQESEAIIVTPSTWSRDGFLRSGADAGRIVVVPHGVDTDTFHPLPDDERHSLRKQLGWEDSFVLLNIGAMTENKGIRYLLKAVAVLLQRFPQIKLCVKGLDSLYTSRKNLEQSADLLTGEEFSRVRESLVYIGEDIPFQDLARIYNASDAYISPYIAEGFNMPVLEAAACGLPVICTAGGATDDFADPVFARRIDSSLMESSDGRRGMIPDLPHLVELITECITGGGFDQSTRRTIHTWVANRHSWRQAVDTLLSAFDAH